MKIVRIEAATVWVDLVKPYITADYPDGMKGKPCVIVRMTTDSDLSGLGESDPFPTFTYESPESVLHMIRHRLGPAILGMDPGNLVALHTKMDAVLPGWSFAKAPLDVAAYDILGQAWGVPMYMLLGGKLRDQVPMIWPIGGDTPETNAREAKAKVDDGYRSIHIKVGALAAEVDIARVERIRATVGDDIPLMLDANQGWDRTTALRTIKRLEISKPSMVEQPVPAWDIESMVDIQASVGVPISADEVLHSHHDAMNLIRRDAARVFSLKTGKCGGLFRTRQIAAMAEAAGIPCFVNSMIEMGVSVMTSLHLAASIPNLVDHGHALMSNLRIKEDILPAGSFQYEGRNILVPEGIAGLGVKLDMEEVEKRTLDHFVLEL
ncbi:MAG: dipeptide epimerase [Chloroflexi bacterium]|nr:dipeptide epimerase [Chloroflexota bacterium]